MPAPELAPGVPPGGAEPPRALSPAQVPAAGRRRLLSRPLRVDIAVLCFLGQLIAYCDRVNISIAAPDIMREHGWTTAQMGWVLSAFFLGYVACMVPAGILADRFGPKRLLGFSMAWWSAFGALTAVPRSIAGLVTTRVLMGTGESATLPATNGILARWFPRKEYSRAAGFCWSGGYAGPIIAFPLSTAILYEWGWRAIFYSFGAVGALWLLVWWWRADDFPESSRHIRREELEAIVAARPAIRTKESAPWRAILRSPAVWSVNLLHFSSNWYVYVLNFWLPTYLENSRHFSLRNMAFGSTMPFVSAWLASNVFAALIDHFSLKHDRTRVSKAFLSFYAAAAGMLVLVPFAHGVSSIVLLFSLATALLTAATPVYASGSLDLAPRYAGSFVGLQNGFANLAGVLAPVVTGCLIANCGWEAAFVCAALVSGLGIAVYLCFGRALAVFS